MFEIYLIYTHLHQQLSECFYRPPEGAQTEQWEWKGEGRQTLKAPISDAASNKNQIWQRWAGATAAQLSGKAFVWLCVCVCVYHTLMSAHWHNRQLPRQLEHEQGQGQRNGQRHGHGHGQRQEQGQGQGQEQRLSLGRRPAPEPIAGHVAIKKTFMALCSNIKWI